MKIRMEPTERLLTLTPDVETTLEAEGFFSALYRPEQDRYPGKVLIVVSGMDGSYSLTRLIGEQFVSQGMTVLALAYWGRKGLPRQCSRIPLETVERAASWLRRQGYGKIGMWGISLGAVYALLCGCALPELLGCIVAVSPMDHGIQGVQRQDRWSREERQLEGSAFAFRGQDVPYGPESPIPVERLNGPLLLLAADRDQVWPARQAAEAMVHRLRERNFLHPLQYEHYAVASHYLLPCQINARLVFPIEREQPEGCARSDRDAFEKTLRSLREQW